MPTDPLRILHVIQNLNYGGMERLLADLITRSDRSRFEHHVLVLQYLGRFSRDLESIARLHLAPRQSRGALLHPRRLIREFRRIAPDVVHSHSGVWLKASRAARGASVPRMLYTEHGRQSPDPWSARVVDGLASRSTDVVVAVSEPLAEQLRATVVRGRRARIVVIRNGVDTDRFGPVANAGNLRSELGLPANVPILGSVGRLEPIKGYDTAVAAFGILSRQLPPGPPAPHLVLVGDGTERERLRAQAADDPLIAARVHFLGWRDDVEDLLASYTVFTMSSRSEGTSVSLLEAMSVGRCPVVTDVGGNAGVLGPELRHRLVARDDPEALAHAWRHALSDEPARLTDATRARARVVAEFGIAAMVGRYERLYAEPQGSA